jgi:hypothetical protein
MMSEELKVYPFPLRPGQFAYLELPPDLTRLEVERLAAFLLALAKKEQPLFTASVLDEVPPLG